MSAVPLVFETLMGRYTARARKLVASPPRAEDVRVIRHIIRSAIDVFAAINRLERTWRRDVCRGRKPYLVEDDASVAALYRGWLSDAEAIAAVALELEGRGREIRALRALEWRIATAAWLKSKPDARLMDFGSIAPNPRPIKFGVTSLSRFVAAYPEHADKLLAADRDAAEGTAELTPLSEYLLSRNAR